MNISLDWISDYVDLSGLDIDLVVSRLTLATAEVEGVKKIQRNVKGVVVGEVTAIERLDANHTFCNVNCGNKDYTTICGAPNVKIGMKAPFAPIGTVLAGNKLIETTKISNKISQGVLCSAAEIGLSTWHEILFEIPNNITNGTPIIELIPESDTLIEIDNKSLTHRPDLWGHYGFAREFAVIFKRELKPLPQLDLDQFNNLPAYPLQNCDYVNCSVYGCIEFLTCGVIPSPLYIQRRLHALGLRSYNLLVDVTNYVSWEIGQPTHAFDADKLGGIKIETAGKSMKFTTLDNQVRNLLPEDLLIWGGLQTSGAERQYNPVAIAGVMGGAETEVTNSTTKILIESANFNAARIRRTSGRLDLRTDASQRYEKTQPPANVKTAAARILKLISDSSIGSELKVLSRFTVDGDLQDKIREINIPAGRFEQLSGIKIPSEQIVNILHSLGFEAKFNADQSLFVGVPPFRSAKDISIQEDIIEEVLRIYGYDNIPPIMPEQPIRPLFVEKQLKMEHKIQKLLSAGHHFLEVHNYNWFNDTWLKTIDYDAAETLVLKNPTSPETTKLRTTLLPNLFALVPKNRPFRDSFRFFEIGRVFFPTGKNEECIEEHRLAGVAFKQSASGNSLEEFYLLIKSAVEDIFSVCNIRDVRFVESSGEGDLSYPVWCSAGSWIQIYVGDQVVGSLGVLDKNMMNKVSPEGGGVVWFEILLDKLDGKLFPEIKFVEPPRYPISWQDFSLVWGIADGFGQLENLLDQFSDPLIVKREFLVSYKGKGLDKDKASYSFRFWIGAQDHTLSGEEIENFHKHFLNFIDEKKISLRN
ncbi:MAG: phenylalanine--tRNA ligase subunit beta [Planctomycetaceae bacterium]|jgi:phenylalanyl-tRNA synthetase beta chain|nr:phenylalanine--tRNA ligase subunit beta [Planctomycetaceae bacterium]